MNDASTQQYGHTKLPSDSADMAQWIVQHAREHGFALDGCGLFVAERVEQLEMLYPMIVEEMEIAPDSMGVGEWLGGSSGLGILLNLARGSLFDTPLMFATLVQIAILGLTSYGLVTVAERLSSRLIQ